MNDHNNGTDDTSPTFKAFEEGSATMSKEKNMQLAIRQEKFIRDLKNAIIRIENKTYGICRVTGNWYCPAHESGGLTIHSAVAFFGRTDKSLMMSL